MTSSTSEPVVVNGNGNGHSNGNGGVASRMEKRLANTQKILVVLIAVVVVIPFFYNWWLGLDGDTITYISVSDMHIEGKNTFCPGETLTVDFHFESRGAGTLEEDVTWFRLKPDMTVEPSNTKTYILPEPFAREVYRSWVVPRLIVDEKTGNMIPLPPGQYRRLYTVASKANPAIHSLGWVDIIVSPACS